jgi:lipid-A-disaccharide synthase
MRTLLISAAEPSGDRLAAELLQALQELGPVRARGIAGPRMREAGCEPVAKMEDVCAMGLAEVLGKLGPIKQARAAMRCSIDEGADALVVVDAPDLHLPLARRATKRGIPAIGYVSPQIWAWRSGRARHIASSLDALLCLFEFEPALYRQTGLDVRWTGHPLVDRMPARGPVDPQLFGLLPGSRDQELSRLLRPFLATATVLREQQPEARFRLVGEEARVRAITALPDWVEVVPDIQSLSGARGALSKSGTVTLELALMGVPMVVAHRVHPLTYWLGRALVRGVSHISLPNVLAGEEVVPEYIQHFHPETLAEELAGLPQSQALALSAVGDGGASARAAAAVQELWT